MAASSGSVYDVIEVIGTSTESWEKAAVVAVETAAKTLRDLRIAEVVEMDLQIDDGKVRAFRTKVKLSFKYEKRASPQPHLHGLSSVSPEALAWNPMAMGVSVSTTCRRFGIPLASDHAPIGAV